MQIGKNEIAAVILVGGQSRRMGSDKARLAWNGGSLVEHLIGCLGDAFGEVVVSAREAGLYAHLPVRIVADTEAGAGPLCGITSALAATDTEWLFAVACDMPFVEPRVWMALAEHATEHVDAVVPRIDRGLEPLCALYRRSCITPFRARLQSGHYAMKAALRDVRVAEVHWTGAQQDAGPDVFMNVNTPEQLATARAGVASLTKASA